MVKGAALAAALLGLGLCACGTSHRAPAKTATQPAAPARADLAFGATMGAEFDTVAHAGDAGTLRQAVANAASAGVRLVRAGAMWEFLEPDPPVNGVHHFDWRTSDAIVDAVTAAHLRWVAVLAYSPGWASQTPAVLHGAPRDPAEFAAYAGAVAARYRGHVAAYEIWNEENSSAFWRPAPDPAGYLRLYQAARAAIRAVDPSTPVLVGGLANGNDRAYLTALVKQGQGVPIDGVAIHPYGRDPTQVVARVRSDRALLASLGAANLPLYVTEYGWADRPLGKTSWAPSGVRGRYIADVATQLLASDCDVRMAIFYAWMTPDRSLRSGDDWLGIATRDGGPTADTAALADGIRQAPAAAPARVCAPGP